MFAYYKEVGGIPATHFENEGYTVEKYMTARLHVVLKRKDCCVLTRRNLPLINY